MGKRGKWQFIYSFLLVMLVPILVIIHNLWQIRVNQRNLNYELAGKAELIQSIIITTVANTIDNQNALQVSIEKIGRTSDEIQEITLLKPEGDGFGVFASTKREMIGIELESLENAQAWAENKPITFQILDKTKRPSGRTWFSSTPLKDTGGKKIALLNLKIDSREIDALNQKTLEQSLVILAILTLFILLLLANQVKLSHYPIMFQRLSEVDKMKDEFISMASHELKTPLATINGYLEMLLSGLVGKMDAQSKTHLNKIAISAQRLDDLINALLDASRLEQGRMQFDIQPVDIIQVVDKVISGLKSKADEKKLVLTQDKPTQSLPAAYIDPDRFYQVIQNIVDNAIKYTLKGSVKISYQIEGQRLKVIVKDTGIGMSPADSRRLFEKFYRIKNEKTSRINGTGLGLWIAREIVRRMDGDITLQSQENKGSEFYIWLPYIKEEKAK